ncbi:putative UPF0481 protein At3g02645 [Lactuca sativa]|uniref:Uncharacterized protein n=1 Tax=Lactuca sativa TaxID=4236 RepID=A0A9R1UXY1_LACSA|nr:putative UPF0481 protein At3g02645 [Lactuca sativa]KAJ0194828.1 hypothetical protein LSAT_V11C700354010 [Lactuca sativa]
MEVKSGAVDLIRNNLKSLLECKENGQVLRKQAPPSIYMVPSVVQDLSPSSFTPRVVAIGPLHRHDEHLQGFEVQKITYLNNLLHRFCMVPEQTLRKCVEKVIGSIDEIKACYAVSTTYDDLELAKMMVIDACFILEFIQSVLVGLSVGTNTLIIGSIRKDMLLIENQIPYFILEDIFECTVLASGQMTSLTMYMSVFLRPYYFPEGNVVVPDASAPEHILGFLHKYFQPAERMPLNPWPSIKRHSAMELHRAGMKFKPYEDENWALAMELELPLPLFPWFHDFIAIPQFSWFRPPTLRMPKARIHDSSELIFRNLLVYEHVKLYHERYVTSYVCAMDMLINTPEDVALLVKSKVLVSLFGSYEEAADMINKLCKNIPFKLYYKQQWEEMDVYYNSYWPNTLAGLKRTYFNNPWNIIALFAAFVLFALTVVQTIFTIKATNGTSVASNH